MASVVGHLRDHVLQEQQRTIVDRGQAGTETAVEACLRRFLGNNLLLVLPLDAKGRVGQHVVKPLAGEPVAGLAVAQRVTQDDVVGLLILDEHVRTADRPAFVVVFLPIQAELGTVILRADRLFRHGQHTARAACRVVNLAVDAGFVDVLLSAMIDLLFSLGYFMLGVTAVGWLANRCNRNPKLLFRLGFAVVVCLSLAMIISIARGDLFRLAPGGQDSEWDDEPRPILP